MLCERCTAELASAPRTIGAGPPGIDLAVAASPFEGAARLVVHGLKFGRRLGLARAAAEAMLAAMPPRTWFDAVVPIPAAPHRRRWRGFDPAEEIALALANLADRPVAHCLRRTGGRRQVGRRRSERLADPPRIHAAGPVPREALLVDDVWTTGATLSSAARALGAAGCRRVVALTLAHAIR